MARAKTRDFNLVKKQLSAGMSKRFHMNSVFYKPFKRILPRSGDCEKFSLPNSAQMPGEDKIAKVKSALFQIIGGYEGKQSISSQNIALHTRELLNDISSAKDTQDPQAAQETDVLLLMEKASPLSINLLVY